MKYNSDEKPVGTGLGAASAGVAYSAAVVGYLAFSLVFSLIVIATGMTSSSDVYKYLSYLVAPLAVIVTQPICAKRRNTGFACLFPVKTKLKYYLNAPLLAFGLLFSVGFINTGFKELLELIGYESNLNSLPGTGGGMIVLSLFVIAVLPAVCEESLFRGVLLNNMEREAGSINTVLLVGFAFSLFHANILQTVYQFICGCSLALLAIRSRSILPSVLVHFINNAVIIIMNACGMDVNGNIFDMVPLWAAILVVVLSALSFIAAAFLLIFDKTPTYKPQKGGVKNFFIYGSVGICALVIMFIANLF